MGFAGKVFVFSTLLLLIGFAPVRGADDPAPSREQIARWIEQLGDNNFATREKASEMLWKAGDVAEPALQEAQKSKDPEIARRARDLLDKFKLGIYPDTPQAVVKLIDQFRAADANGKPALVPELLKHGKHGYRALRKLAALEENEDMRRNLLDQVAREGSQLAGTLLAEGDFTAAEEMLEAGLAGMVEEAVRNYAAYVLLRGQADDKVRKLRDRVERSGDRDAAEVLTYLYRAKGDLKNARWAAEKAGKDDLLEPVLEELGDYKALAALVAKKPNGDDGRSLSVARALFHRLAGNVKEFEAELRRFNPDEANARDVFLFNGRPQDTVDAYCKRKEFAAAFMVLAQQQKFREAFELADKFRPEAGDNQIYLEISEAEALYKLGEKEKAQKLFERLVAEVPQAKDTYGYGHMISVEYKLGLKDQAFAHCADILSQIKREKGKGEVAGGHFLHGLFPKHGWHAELWWGFLRRKFPDENHAATLKRLRDIFEEKKAAKDFDELADEAEKSARGLSPEEHQRWLQALVETCLLVGKDQLAQNSLERETALTGSAGALTRLADFLAERKQWDKAATVYGQAWEKDKKDPVPLYLRGWALTKLGQDKEGKKLMERAHWLPLANESARYSLAEALAKHGLEDAARRERELVVRTGAFRSVYASNVLDEMADEAVARKDYLTAADCTQRILVIVLQSGAFFLESEANLLVPFWVRQYRARGLLAAGKVEDALKEADQALTMLPGNIELPLQLVPELDRKGRKDEADQLFARVLAVNEKLCSDYPRAADGHNNVAWLAAGCRRQLDKALEHARKAVELEPKNAGYLDTLAEVYFQRGDKDRALALMKKCIEMEPDNTYFPKQLKRFEAGDRNAEVPR